MVGSHIIRARRIADIIIGKVKASGRMAASLSRYGEIVGLIAKMEHYERNELRYEYPRALGLRHLLDQLENARNPAKIKKITLEVDTYIKRGIGWGEHPAEKEAIKAVYDYAREKRRLVFTALDLTHIDRAISFFSDKAKAMPSEKSLQSACRKLRDVREIMQSPDSIGLYEESQFSTIRQEISFDFKLIRRWLKRDCLDFVLGRGGLLLDAVLSNLPK